MNDTVSTVFNAFNAGSNLGGRIKHGRDQKEISGMIASGDIAGAQKAAAATGNAAQVQKLKEFAATQDKAQIEKAKQNYEIYGQIAFAAKNIPLEQRQSFIASRLQQSGRDPELAAQLTSFDDDTLTAFGQSALSVKDQLAQFTTEFTTINDTAVAQRTNNFTGQASATNAFVADPAYSDVTTRTNNEANNKLEVETLAETKRSNQAQEAIDRRKAATAATKGATFSSPKPIRNRETGEVTYMQFSSEGGVRKADLPEGYEFVDDLKAVDTGTATAFVDPTTGQTVKTVEKDVRGKQVESELGKAEGKQQFMDAKDKKLALATAKKNSAKVTQLLSGDLSAGFQQAFGASGIAMRRVPGSAANSAWAVLQEITGPQTLDELAKMKGVPSDKDIELVKGAATALNDPNISDRLATQKLLEIEQGYQRLLALPDAAPTAPSPSSIPAGAVSMLKADPSLASMFDSKYGAGASEKVLSNG